MGQGRNPLVSVIIPIYRTEAYLEKCVRSVLEQTYTNLEIILVDDGSPDNCASICDRLAMEDTRVLVIHKTNGGVSDARNHGMAASLGEYLFFIDSDDFIKENAIETLLKKAIETNADIVCGDYYAVNEAGEKISSGLGYVAREVSAEEAVDYFTMKDWGAWGKLYRREIHIDILFPFGKLHEDEAIMFRLLSCCKKIVLLPDKLYFYLQRKNSITSQAYDKRKMDWFYGWRDNTSLIEQVYPQCLSKCLSKAWDTALYNITHLIGTVKNQRELDELYEFAKKYRREILHSPDIRMSRKIRLLLFLFSNPVNPGCIYCRFYRAIRRM